MKGFTATTARIARSALKLRDFAHRLLRPATPTPQTIGDDSGALFRAVMENISDFITLLNENGTVIYESPSVARQLGYGTEEIVGRSVFDFVHPEDLPRLMRTFSEGIKTPQIVVELECRFRHKGGDWHVLEIVAKNMLHDPIIRGIVVTSRDVTDRRRSEREKTMFSYALQSIGEAVSITDLDGTVLFANEAFLRLHDYQEKDILGRPLTMVLSTRHPENFFRQIAAETLRGGWAGEAYYRRRDGFEFPVAISSSLIRDQQRQPLAFIQVARDIMERKQAEEELRLSEEKYRALFSNVLDGVYQTKPDGRILTINHALAEMLGYRSVDEVLSLGGALKLYVNPDDRRQWRERMEQQGVVRNTEVMLWRKDGSVLVGLENAHTVRNANGEVLYFEGTITDITERKRAEDALRESEESYRRFFEDDLTGDYISTPSGRMLSCNPAFARIFGYSSVEEAMKQHATAFYTSPEDRRAFLDLLRREKRLEYHEMEARRRDGKPVYVIENVVGIFDDHDNLIQIKGYLFDITERKRLEEEVRQAQKMESVGTLAGGIAHDFNNILAIILAYTSRLTKGEPEPAKVKQGIEAIMKAVDRGAGMVRQLLTFARRTEVHIESVDLNDLICDLTKLLHETFPRTLVCSTALQDDLPHITADRNQLNQALLNLCVNARDAMPSGGEINIRTSVVGADRIREFTSTVHEGRYVCLTVTDTGVGMDGETLSRIFEPFYTTKERGQGTGLGLAVVYGVVKGHNGYLHVESQVGKGTTFYLFLPITPRRVESLPREQIPMEEIPGGSETLLYVEDEEYLRQQVEAVLQEKGYTLLAVDNGADAVQLYRTKKGQIDLVLMDMGLPKLGGWEALKQIRAIDPAVRSIALSGYFDPAIRSELSAQGPQAFLQKPFRPEELLLKIREMLDLPEPESLTRVS